MYTSYRISIHEYKDTDSKISTQKNYATSRFIILSFILRKVLRELVKKCFSFYRWINEIKDETQLF